MALEKYDYFINLKYFLCYAHRKKGGQTVAVGLGYF
jgi:hypothetical protein